jgi:hypothetical protein
LEREKQGLRRGLILEEPLERQSLEEGQDLEDADLSRRAHSVIRAP